MNIKNKLFPQILFYVLLLCCLTIVLFPIYWIFSTSLKGPLEVIAPHQTLLPIHPTLKNFSTVLKTGFWKNAADSLIVTICSVFFALFTGSCASYSIIRHKFPLNFNAIFLFWILIVKVLPPVILAIPLYSMLNSLKLINHLTALVIVYQIYILPYAVWMLSSFFKILPHDFEEAAMIDGANKWYILFKIVLPLSKSGIIATAIFSCITCWDEFLFAMLFIRNPSKQTLPIVIANYIGEYETKWGELAAIGLLTCIPLLFFTNFVYKYYTESISKDLK